MPTVRSIFMSTPHEADNLYFACSESRCYSKHCGHCAMTIIGFFQENLDTPLPWHFAMVCSDIANQCDGYCGVGGSCNTFLLLGGCPGVYVIRFPISIVFIPKILPNRRFCFSIWHQILRHRGASKLSWLWLRSRHFQFNWTGCELL